MSSINIQDIFINEPEKYETSNDVLAICGDALIELKKIKKENIDLIFADPPYNLGKDFGKGKVDVNNKQEYIDWCVNWIDECFRILKTNGTFYIMNATQFMPYLDIYIQEKYNIISRIVWHYDSSGRQAKTYFGSLYEPILMCTKNKSADYTFNSEDILVEAKTGAKRNLIDYRKDPPQPYNTKKVPGNIWNFNRVRYRMPEYEKHPSQKPELLLNRIILASSNPGDLVLDPFSGTFTTCAVSKKLGRNSIGIEIEPEYFKIGIKRTKITDYYNGKELKLFSWKGKKIVNDK